VAMAVVVVVMAVMMVVIVMMVIVSVVIMVVMVMVMIMVVMVVIMIMAVMVMMTTARQVVLALGGLEQVLHRHLLFGGLVLIGHVVHHLVLEQRRAQLDQRRRVLFVIFVDVALLARIAARLLDQGTAQLVLVDLDVVLFADLADHEAEAHAPLGDPAIVGAQL